MSYPKTSIVDANSLQKNPWNTNITTPENEAKLEASIKRFGFFRPVVVRELGSDLQIIGGQHRWEIADRLGMKVPIINLGPITDQEAKEISIADNVRYGTDDTIAFAEFIREMGNSEELSDFLPYTDADFADLFSSTDIALDELELDESLKEAEKAQEEEQAPRVPKTHTIMRFKVSLRDAETLTGLIAATQRANGYIGSDDLTNAGDALTHLLISDLRAEQKDQEFTLDDFDEDLNEALG